MLLSLTCAHSPSDSDFFQHFLLLFPFFLTFPKTKSQLFKSRAVQGLSLVGVFVSRLPHQKQTKKDALRLEGSHPRSNGNSACQHQTAAMSFGWFMSCPASSRNLGTLPTTHKVTFPVMPQIYMEITSRCIPFTIVGTLCGSMGNFYSCFCGNLFLIVDNSPFAGFFDEQLLLVFSYFSCPLPPRPRIVRPFFFRFVPPLLALLFA
ncbi:hypothetical protein EDB82DRAFT_271120 [Fusarium venenatum]|uniref:uncharacterized protein n=1 Tax=Fusarium venenatum TaxID=56646 RepID=UPI001DDCE16A|nr:hypothetical protein EDB82DRAFT_271120 [Fusarium venenatum]